MMAAYFLEVLLAGCFLCLCCTFGDAFPNKAVSLTSSIIERTRQINLFEHAEQVRRKRDVTAKTLDDPKGCLAQCRVNETKALGDSIVRSRARMLTIARQIIKSNKTGEKLSPEEETALDGRLGEVIVTSMGPWFDDICNVHKNTSTCYSKCADSQARTVLSSLNEVVQASICEQGNWKNYSEYLSAVNCSEEVGTSACEKKCGPESDLSNETRLEVGDDDEFFGAFPIDDDDDDNSADDRKQPDDINVKYETDSKKNNAAASRVCKTVSCSIEYSKSAITKTCGAKAYDMYVRFQTLGVRYPYSSLKALKAVDQVDDCKPYA